MAFLRDPRLRTLVLPGLEAAGSKARGRGILACLTDAAVPGLLAEAVGGLVHRCGAPNWAPD